MDFLYGTIKNSQSRLKVPDMIRLKDSLKNLFSSYGSFPEEDVSFLKALCGALIVAALSALFWFIEYHFAEGMLSRDGYGYLMFVRRARAAGWSFAAERMPDIANAPPLLLILMYTLDAAGIDAAFAGRMLNLLGLLLSGAGVFFCTLRICRNFQLALAGSLITVVIPKLYEVSCNIMRDPLYWAIMIWCLYTVLAIKDSFHPEKTSSSGRFLRQTVTLAFLLGSAIITRKEGGFLCFVISIWFAGTVFLRPEIKWYKAAAVILLYLAMITVISFMPYILGTGWYPGKTLINDLTLSGVL